MSLDLDEMEKRIQENKYSPANSYWDVLTLLEQANSDLVPLNNSTPWTTLLGHGIVQAVINNNEIDKLHRNLSPEYAENYEELARFLPYQTLALIYAKPLTTTAKLYLRLRDIRDYGVVVSAREKKVLIPRDSIYSHSDGTKFGSLFDIEITLTDGSVVDAVYVDNTNPIKSLVSPVIKVAHLQRRLDDNTLDDEIVELTINLDQYSKSVTTYPITAATGFSKTLTVSNQFYHARVYTRQSGSWVECTTAFSDFIYDPRATIPTAVLKLTDTLVNISIPQIFITNGLVGSEVKVELYTTKGYQTLDYSLTNDSTFSIDFTNRNLDTLTYSNPLKQFSDVFLLMNDKFIGGEDIPSFDVLREQVVKENLTSDPITELQLTATLNRLGYSFIHASNYLTENTYLASKALPLYTTDTANVLHPGGNLPILLENLSESYGVLDNGNNYTITPDAVIKYINGQSVLLNSNEVTTLLNNTTLNLVSELNTVRYLNPVFHYVVESLVTENAIEVYHLRSPSIVTRDFIGINPNGEGTIGVSGVAIAYNKTGYTLEVTTASTSYYQGLDDTAFIAQLVVSSTTGQKLSMNHTGVERTEDGDYVFTFNLSTNFDIRRELGIDVTSLTTEYNEPGFINLTQLFELSFNLVSDLPETLDTQWQTRVESSKLPSLFQVVTLESVTVSFGERIDAIHCPVRTLAGSVEYVTHTEDVLAYHEKDVPQRDSNNRLIFTDNPDYTDSEPVSETNRPFIYQYEHRAGDPVIVNGVHQVLYPAGSVVLDEFGQAVELNRGVFSIETALICADMRFILAEVSDTLVADQLLGDVQSDIDPLRDKMIQLSELFYDVSRTVGKTTVRISAEKTAYIDREVSLVFDVVVDTLTYRDADTRDLIVTKIKETASNLINGATSFSSNSLITAIDAALGTSVIGFRLERLASLDDVTSFTVTTEGDVLGIAPKLEIDNTGKLAITDDITINITLESS